MREAFFKSFIAAAIKGEKDARKMVFDYVMSRKDVKGFKIDAADQQVLDDLLKRLNQQEG